MAAAASIIMSGFTGETKVQRRRILLPAAAIAVSALVAPVAATAAETKPVLVADPAGAERDFVRWLSVHDPRPVVRETAQPTLTGGDATTFLAAGYTAAADRAARERAWQLDFADRTAAAYPARTHPWVHAAARRAAAGTDDELAGFAAGGFTAALAQDDAGRPYDDGAGQVTPDDRALVADLGHRDPNLTVRHRAADVRTDAEVAEFLRHGWLSAARLDLDAFRAEYVAGEWAGWDEARYHIGVAVTADRQARQGTAPPIAAVTAWRTVGTRAVKKPAIWTERERYAQGRADTWTRTALTATASPSPLRAALATDAPAVHAGWIAEARHAADQRTWWQTLIRYAQDTATLWTRSGV
jgi:hypothetical protein